VDEEEMMGEKTGGKTVLVVTSLRWMLVTGLWEGATRREDVEL
jgi:hypothetical protein